MNDIISTLIATAMTTGTKLTFNIYDDHTTVEVEPPKEPALVPIDQKVEIPEAKTEQPETPEKKKKPERWIDHGRIVALYTANPPRSVRWIADDMGISPQTVINHLVKEGIYKARGDKE